MKIAPSRYCYLLSTIASLIIVLGVVPLHAQPNLYEEYLVTGLEEDANFGVSVSVSGPFMIVGADLSNNSGTNSGMAFIYEFDGTDWYSFILDPTPNSVGDHFGRSVSICGEYAIIGAWGFDSESGAAYIFKWDDFNSLWTQHQLLTPPLTASGAQYGFAVAIDGDCAIVGDQHDNLYSSNSGCAYVYRSIAGIWTLEAQLKPPTAHPNQGFGYSVDIRNDLAIVGAPFDTLNSGVRTGAAYVFEWNNVAWIPVKRLAADDGEDQDLFGGTVSIENDFAIVGAEQRDEVDPHEGAAYIFSKVSVWTHQTKILASDGGYSDHFGSSVSISGEYAFVGADMKDEGASLNHGRAYVYTWNGSIWKEGILLASDSDPHDYMGASISVGRDREFAAVSAPGWKSGSDVFGAVYIYSRPFRAEYFIHMADPHVSTSVLERLKWNTICEKVLSMRPPPEFVVCAGDLVTYGAGSGSANYAAMFDESLYLYTDSENNHSIRNLPDSIPIFFCPGNHDYRYGELTPWPHDSGNYKTYAHDSLYYSRIINSKAAIFSMNSGWDKFDDIWPWCHNWPEGAGLFVDDMNALEGDLDDLDNSNNNIDTSHYTKIIFMHHPHKSPKKGKWCKDSDGEFLYWNDPFRTLCNQYEVDYVLCGHLHKKLVYDINGNSWKSGETKCFAANDADGGDFHWHEIRGDASGNINLWHDIIAHVPGSVFAFAIDQNGDTTGIDGNGNLLLDIPWSGCNHFVIADTEFTVNETVTHISVQNSASQDYTFKFEAYAPEAITIMVRIEEDDDSDFEFTYENVLMQYEESGDTGSVATLISTGSEFNYRLLVEHPDNTWDEYYPTIVTAAHMLPSLNATGYDGFISLQWTVEGSQAFEGFNIHRGSSQAVISGEVNESMIPIKGSPDLPVDYSLNDMAVENDVTYYYWLETIDSRGESYYYGPVSAIPVSEGSGNETPNPLAFSLSPNYPNPFNASTSIEYSLPIKCHVELVIFSVAGRRIRTLVDAVQSAGYKSIHWNGRNDAGYAVASGIYFYRIEAGDFTDVRKMILLR